MLIPSDINFRQKNKKQNFEQLCLLTYQIDTVFCISKKNIQITIFVLFYEHIRTCALLTGTPEPKTNICIKDQI